MKYFKKSCTILVLAVILNMVVAYAYTNTTVTFGDYVSFFARTTSIEKTKDTSESVYQKAKVLQSTCSNCTFSAQPLAANGSINYLTTGNISVGQTKNLTSDANGMGDYKLRVWRDDSLALTKKYTSFVYAPNGVI